MKYALETLIVCIHIANSILTVSGSVCSWKTMNCGRDEVLCDQKESVLLDAKNPQKTEAISKNKSFHHEIMILFTSPLILGY